MARLLLCHILCALFAGSYAFVAVPSMRQCREHKLLLVRATLDDAADSELDKPSATMEGITAFRERQLKRANGAPLSVWSQGADRADFFTEDAAPADERQGPPTEEQAAAANELFTKVLREEGPDSFGDGLEEFGI